MIDASFSVVWRPLNHEYTENVIEQVIETVREDFPWIKFDYNKNILIIDKHGESIEMKVSADYFNMSNNRFEFDNLTWLTASKCLQTLVVDTINLYIQLYIDAMAPTPQIAGEQNKL